jgi:hypothetical protein
VETIHGIMLWCGDHMPSSLLRAASLWVVAASLLAQSAQAQTAVFRDDFESGTLLTSDTPPGQWDYKNTSASSPQVTLGLTGAAANQGSLWGLRYSDAAGNGSGSGSEPQIGRYFTARSGDYYVRVAFRLSGLGASGSANVVQIQGTVPSGTMLEVGVENPGPSFFVGGFDSAGQYQSALASTSIPQGEWHVFEAVLRGVGTATASRELWIDGQRVALDSPVAMVGQTFNHLIIGGAWVDRSFTGTLDFDDVGAQPTPFLTPDAGTAPDAGILPDGGVSGAVDAGSSALTFAVGCACSSMAPATGFWGAVLSLYFIWKCGARRRASPLHVRP